MEIDSFSQSSFKIWLCCEESMMSLNLNFRAGKEALNVVAKNNAAF
jgi:hypothetical protein